MVTLTKMSKEPSDPQGIGAQNANRLSSKQGNPSATDLSRKTSLGKPGAILTCHHNWEDLMVTLTKLSKEPSDPQGIGAQKRQKLL